MTVRSCKGSGCRDSAFFASASTELLMIGYDLLFDTSDQRLIHDNSCSAKDSGNDHSLTSYDTIIAC